MVSLKKTNDTLMREVIQRIATGPALSKDLSAEQAEQAMQQVLRQQADPIHAAIFFIALRMKRETDDENIGVLRAIRQATRHCVAAVDEVVDLFDPYNGYIRCLPMSPFIPCVLAACGLPCYSHGIERVGPKYGVTHEEVMAAAGINVALPVDEAAMNLASPDIAWAYVSQSQFCPQLSDLSDLRHKIVKRSILTTVEGFAGALTGRKQTHLVTGYVHKAYPPIYLELARTVGYSSALVIRGVEGGVVPSLRQNAKVHRLVDESITDLVLEPANFSIEQSQRAVALPAEFAGIDGVSLNTRQRKALAQTVLESGLAVLSGEPSMARDALVYGAAIILWHCGRAASHMEAAEQVAQAIDNGIAANHFKALQQA